MSNPMLMPDDEAIRLAPPPPRAKPAPSRVAKGASVAAAGEVRVLAPQDVAAVAALFQKSFRSPGDAAPDSLRRYLDDLFLCHPGADPELPSRVHVGADGVVNGFIGVLPARMQFNGRPLRAAIAGSLMVADPQRDPLAGARLMRAFFKGPQDLSFSESANPLSQGMWERLGGFAVAPYSMEWVRVLKPAGTALAAAGLAAPLAGVLRPLAWGLDRATARLSRRVLKLAEVQGEASGTDVGQDSILRLVPQLAAEFALAPTWQEDVLVWLLTHAEEKERHGPLHRRVVTGRGGRVLGLSLYYGRPDGIAWTLQILARPDGVGAVVDDLFADAARRGCVAVRGRSTPHILDALLRRHCLMLHRASTVVHTRDPELLQAVRSGDAMLNGLAGESWTRLIGGEFA